MVVKQREIGSPRPRGSCRLNTVRQCDGNINIMVDTGYNVHHERGNVRTLSHSRWPIMSIRSFLV
ncbi:Hypothetical predicted protein [Olea europaea subsp. europaea]|uniref:Uncharacterized protein n=1 Tax=Olea europaea subsp. europaea TaxID=158383 RepID=A0A8S0S008_OLEEU|nr:Hypothetical predicted protein [Olea europaea subsp. europaea]